MTMPDHDNRLFSTRDDQSNPMRKRRSAGISRPNLPDSLFLFSVKDTRASSTKTSTSESQKALTIHLLSNSSGMEILQVATMNSLQSLVPHFLQQFGLACTKAFAPSTCVDQTVPSRHKGVFGHKDKPSLPV